MKKLIAILIILAVMLSLTACGRDDSGSDVNDPPAAVSETVGADGTTPPEQSPDQPASPSGS